MSEAKELVKKMCDIQNKDPEIQAAMKGWKGVVQYQIDGSEEFFVEYSPDGKCVFKDGKAEKPTFTIIATSKFWCDVLRGKEDPVASFMMGKYKITGNIMESQKLGKIAKQFRGKYQL
ncbi:MAG: SCP2 sterol-binding domain-containing protein [Archaeoglobaceae archaeon]|nr:SCP2 sterol-binding domain-containing protein [Archaeoglobaceae archaeon]MDW8117663.1 SCP2 sterol-binding domain-containing protein [Archaeoglobaceae archaeon]